MVGSRQWIDGGWPENGARRRAFTPECGRFTTEDIEESKCKEDITGSWIIKEPFADQGKPASLKVMDFVTEEAAASEGRPCKGNPRVKQPQGLTREGVSYRSELRKLAAACEDTTWVRTRTSKTSLLGGPLPLLDCGGSGVASIISVPFGGPTYRLWVASLSGFRSFYFSFP